MLCGWCGQFLTNKRNKEYCNKTCRNRALAHRRDQTGENNPHWKGGEKQNGNYMMKLVNGEYVYLHRWLMEQELGRKLEQWEEVHHIDEDPLNNELSNLEVKSKVQHLRDHAIEWVKNRKRDEKGRLI